ncbi:AP2-like ethylene-responsive transcription factor PLT1 [Senna tora]|uniref:AP2-like ethylene-responsive transcription factor PLT1 n=1 Tax=Senna tora TaxID=362788 RepID=A0A834TCT4_9FABA|nr:AP2-like ethylene-responsive transcription factor PLT1 [Senna tora]
MSRITSAYRGVTRSSRRRKWQARIGKSRGTNGIYVGAFNSERDAARAYDIASIRLKGEGAVTNFDMSTYDIQSIMNNPKIPIGDGASKLLRDNTVGQVLHARRRITYPQHPNYINHLVPSSSAAQYNTNINNNNDLIPNIQTDDDDIDISAMSFEQIQEILKDMDIDGIMREIMTELEGTELFDESVMDELLGESDKWSSRNSGKDYFGNWTEEDIIDSITTFFTHQASAAPPSPSNSSIFQPSTSSPPPPPPQMD